MISLLPWEAYHGMGRILRYCRPRDLFVLKQWLEGGWLDSRLVAFSDFEAFQTRYRDYVRGNAHGYRCLITHPPPRTLGG